MTFKRLTSICVSSVWFTGCISTHYGKESAFVQDTLKVSCAPDLSIVHEVVKSVNCTLENTGHSWIKVNVSKFEPHLVEDRTVVMDVLSPERVQSFASAYRFQKQKSDHNTALVLSGLLIGATAAVTSNSKGSGAAAASVLGTAMAAKALAGPGIDPEVPKSDIVGYGPQHLLGGAFELPPKSFVRKKVLIQSRSYEPEDAWPDRIELCLNESAQGTQDGECRKLSFQTLQDAVVSRNKKKGLFN